MKAFKIAAVLAVLTVAGCGDDDNNTASEPGTTFDGEACHYDGPNTFEIGEVTFHVVNDSDVAVGFGFINVIDGATTDQIAEEGMENFIETAAPSGETRQPGTNDEGVEYNVAVDLDTAGLWAANCWVGSGWGTDYPAAILTVNP
jgi:hypothetical protein